MKIQPVEEEYVYIYIYVYEISMHPAVKGRIAPQVILYHALPFYVYTLAWIWHGISNEDLLILGSHACRTQPLGFRV